MSEDSTRELQTSEVQASKDQAVVIERILDAAPETVWQMWTDSDQFKAWYGPTGASIPVADMDLRVGGKRLVSMKMETPDGPMQMWFTGEYKEIVENQRLVYSEAMADEDGNAKDPAEMGMPEGHPTDTEIIVELENLDDKTKMTMTHAGVPADSPAAIGWNMAFDKLVVHLAA